MELQSKYKADKESKDRYVKENKLLFSEMMDLKESCELLLIEKRKIE